MATVQLIGTASNASGTPDRFDIGAERWCFNAFRSYRHFPDATSTWTRWFNFHSKQHMLRTYPETYDRYKTETRPIYLQEADPDVPSSLTFPRVSIQNHFTTNGVIETFFTCSCSWLLAFAMLEGFQRIEVWGFEAKADSEWRFQRPCISYWIGRARQAGIDVFLPDGVTICKADKLYGYETT